MKSRLLTLIGCLATVFMARAGAELVWLTEEHDFGAFDEDLGVVSCTFEGVNVGDEPLVVLNARANCGCTTPHYSDRPVAPGDTARVTVGFDASGRPGKFKKSVQVTTNANPAKTTLNICGTVIGTANTLRSRYPVDAGAMKLRSDVLMFGEITVNETGGRYIEAYNSLADTLRPRILSKPEHISVTISPAAVPPGENFVISTVFDPFKAGQWDIVNDTVSIAAGGRRIDLKSVAIVREDFSKLTGAQLDRAPVVDVEPSMIDCGRINPADKPLTFTLQLKNKGHEPMIVRRVYSADPSVSVKIKKQTVKPGKAERIAVVVDPAQLGSSDMLNARIIIITNDPANPRTVVRVVGEVKP